MTTAGQNAAAGLGLSLILANLLNGPQRPALRGFVTGPDAAGKSGKGKGINPLDPHVNPWSPLNPLPGMPPWPDIPGVPQGPLTGIPFSPVSNVSSIGPLQALLEVAGEFVFVAVLVVAAEDYPAAVLLFLTILWILFLATRTAHPWRSQRLAAAASSTPREA